MADDIMKYENTLPMEFTGTFYFTNATDEEFVGKWGGKDYHFAANATSPMIIPDQTPLEIQHIRKKFAKDLAEREFFKSQKYEQLRVPEGTLGNRTMSGIHTANTYTLDDLFPWIQSCLKPLEVKKAFVEDSAKEKTEDKLTRDEEGQLHTVAVDKKTSLRERALNGQGLPQ